MNQEIFGGVILALSAQIFGANNPASEQDGRHLRSITATPDYIAQSERLPTPTLRERELGVLNCDEADDHADHSWMRHLWKLS